MGDILQAPYNVACKTSPKLVDIAGGAKNEGQSWSDGLAEDASFDKVLACWKDTGASLTPPELKAGANRIATALQEYTTFCESFAIPTKKDETDNFVDRASQVQKRVETTLAEGVAMWSISTLTPVAKAKAHILKEQPGWSKNGCVFHKALDAAIKKVMRLKKP